MSSVSFSFSLSWQDELAKESSERIVERSDAAVTKVVQQGQGSRSGRVAGPRGGGRGRGRGGGETSAADKKTSLRGSVRAQAENTLAHRTRPEAKRESVSCIISVLSNAVPDVFTVTKLLWWSVAMPYELPSYSWIFLIGSCEIRNLISVQFEEGCSHRTCFCF